MSTDPGPLKDAATRRRREALAQWQHIGAGASACALAKSGVSFPAAKLAEGRVAALGELLRALKKSGSDDPRDHLRETETLRDRWVAERDGGDAGRSRDWEAYRTGGAEELEELAALFAV